MENENEAVNRNNNDYKDVSPIKTDNNGSSSKNSKEITLKNFLEYVSTNVSVISDISILENDKEEALNAILKACKAKRIVGAAVGGLLVNHDTDEVLLYLRPKDPEKYKWSMPGGSIEFKDNATQALINEYEYITGIILKSENLLPLRITNHILKESFPCIYHYLSPAFIVKNPSDFLKGIRKKITDTKALNDDEINELARNLIQDTDDSQKEKIIEALTEDIKSGDYFIKDWEMALKEKLKTQNFKKYIVKWFKISDVIDTDKISEPTKRALRSYQKRTDTINDIADKTKCMLTKAAEETHNNIKGVQFLERIIQTDD
ncbi:MAG: hypothetical protein LBN06_03205 [Prevotellaceae bacterium]|jgi:ADP-ribose pyrophosphatase YjhB (NUDIX family)|nr:hypothetical protein [Prevotellaceae bacterium]